MGSGAGLFGLGLLKSGIKFAKLSFTDVHYEVLNAILTNMKINFPENLSEDLHECLDTGPFNKITAQTVTETNESFLIDEKVVEVKYLDWLNCDDEIIDSLDYNVILGSDLTYAKYNF